MAVSLAARGQRLIACSLACLFIISLLPAASASTASSTAAPGRVGLPANGWAAISPFATGTFGLAVDPRRAGVLWVFAGQLPDAFAHSDDAGETWTYVSVEKPYNLSSLLAVAPDDPHAALVGLDGDEAGRLLRIGVDGSQAQVNSQRLLLPTPDGDQPAQFGQLFVDSNDPDRYYANVVARVAQPGDFPPTRHFGDHLGAPEYRSAIVASTDGGRSWQARRLDARLLAVDSQRRDVLYARSDVLETNEGFISGEPLLKSTDGGVTWVSLEQDQLLTTLVYSVGVDVVDPNRLYATRYRRDPKTWQLWGNMELVISRDAGTSWEVLSPLERVREFEPSRTWTVSVDPARPAAFSVVRGTEMMLQTTDEGVTWTDVWLIGYLHTSGRIVYAPGGEHLYLVTASRGLFRRPTPPDLLPAPPAVCTTVEIAPPPRPAGVAPARPAITHAGGAVQYVQTTDGTTIFRSDDAGQTWSALPFDAHGYRPIAVDRWQPARLYLAGGLGPGGNWSSDSRLYVSMDGDEPSLLSDGPIGRVAYDQFLGRLYQFDQRREFLILDKVDNTFHSGTHDLYRSFDAGRTWSLWRSDARNLKIDPANPTTFYVLGGRNRSYGYPVMKTVNDGVDWFAIDPLPLPLYGTAFVMDPLDSQRLYVTRGETHLFTSSDGGGSWLELPQLAPTPVLLRTFTGEGLPDPLEAGAVFVVGPAAPRSKDEVFVWWQGEASQRWQPVARMPIPWQPGAGVNGEPTYSTDGHSITARSREGYDTLNAIETTCPLHRVTGPN